MGDAVPDWSALPTDVLGYMTKFLPPLMEDLMAFRGVCTTWRAAATKSGRKVPLLMLAEKEGGSKVREFYSFSKGKICMRMPLPGAMGKRCFGVGFGWILTLASNGEVSLLQPFSGAKIKLPSVRTFPDYKKRRLKHIIHFIEAAMLTANPSETTDFKVVVGTRILAGFWSNGAEEWEWLSNALTTIYYKGKVYTLDNTTREIVTWDPHATDFKEAVGKFKVDNIPAGLQLDRHNYLVVSTDGELLLIIRNNAGSPQYTDIGADRFYVARVDPVKGECIEIDGLGKDAIFFGDNAATAIDATEFPGVLKPNCVYFTDDCYLPYFYSGNHPEGGGKDMGIFNFGDLSIERFNVESFSRICPPLWLLFPSL